MEAILISPERVKIILDDTELEKYGIDVTDLQESVNGVTLKRILADVNSDISFDSSGYRLAVQVYACRSGCEIYVTKMISEDNCEGIYIVMCHDISDVNALIRRINGHKKCSEGGVIPTKSAENHAETRLFCTDDQLFFMSDTPLPEFVCDYGQIVPKSSECYIKEYGKEVSMPE